MSATSLVFFSWLSLTSTVSSTTNLFVLDVVRHVKGVKTFMSTTTTAAIHILVEKNYN